MHQLFFLRCSGELLAFSSYSQDLLGVLFLLLVSHPHPPHFGGSLQLRWAISMCYCSGGRKLGLFHHNDTCGHWVVKRAQTAGKYQNGNGDGIESIAKWFNNFWKFEASLFFVGGGKGWVSEGKGQRLGWKNTEVLAATYRKMFKPGKNAVSKWYSLCLAVSKPGVSLSSPLKTDLHLYKVHALCILLNVATLQVHCRDVYVCPRRKNAGLA